VAEVCAQAASIGATVLNVNPGVKVVYCWSLGDATAVDRQKTGMVNAVREKANEALAAWGAEVFRGDVQATPAVPS